MKELLRKLSRELRSYMPHYIACMFAFFILPVIFNFPNAGGLFVVIFNYFLLLPLVCFIISFIFAKNNGFKLLFPIGIGIFAIPSTIMQEFMDIGISWQFAIAYFIISLLACSLGHGLHTFRQR